MTQRKSLPQLKEKDDASAVLPRCCCLTAVQCDLQMSMVMNSAALPSAAHTEDAVLSFTCRGVCGIWDPLSFLSVSLPQVVPGIPLLGLRVFCDKALLPGRVTRSLVNALAQSGAERRGRPQCGCRAVH